MEILEKKIYYTKTLRVDLKLKLLLVNICFHASRKPENVVMGTEVV